MSHDRPLALIDDREPCAVDDEADGLIWRDEVQPELKVLTTPTAIEGFPSTQPV